MLDGLESRQPEELLVPAADCWADVSPVRAHKEVRLGRAVLDDALGVDSAVVAEERIGSLAFYGRCSTEGNQDPETSLGWQLGNATKFVDGRRTSPRLPAVDTDGSDSPDAVVEAGTS